MRHILRRTALVLLLATASLSLLHAQQDIRLTEPSPVGLPNAFGVPGADAVRLGSHTLVVWGSTRVDPSVDSGTSTLRVQLLAGLVPVGDQRDLNGVESAPTSYVKVERALDRFLVFYNDLRHDGPGLYMQMVDTMGANIGGPVKVSTHQVYQYFVPALRLVGDPATGYILLWTDAARVFSRAFDRRGNITGPEITIANGPAEFVTPVGPLGYLILDFPGRKSLLIHPEGSIDPRTIPPARLRTGYHIGPDTSIATLEGTELKIYRSIFDPTPERTVALPEMAGSLEGSRVVTRDGAGRLQVLYARVIDSLPNLHYGIERMTITPTGPTTPELLYEETLKPDTLFGMTSSTVRIFSWQRERGCRQSSKLMGTAVFRVIDPYRTVQRVVTLYHAIDEFGNFRANDTFYSTTCEAPTRVYATRLPGDTIIRVAVIDGNDTLRLEHHRSVATAVNMQTMPNILYRGDRLVTTWSHGIDSSTMMLTVFDGDIGHGPMVVAEHRNYGQPARVPGAEILTRDTTFTVTLPDTANAAEITIYTASAVGWTQSGTIRQVDHSPISIRREDVAYDPNRDEILVGTSVVAADGVHRNCVVAVSPEGTILWRLDSLPDVMNESMSIIPTGDVAFTAVSGNAATRYDRGNVVSRFEFESHWADAEYQRLLGERFLRWHVRSGARSTIDLEIHALDGALLHSASIELGAIVGAPYILDDPSDSSIVILHAADGIRLTHLDRSLEPYVIDRAVSRTREKAFNPAGVFRNDTLEIVWEDRRNIDPDIYGTWWHRSLLSAVRENAAIAGLSASVAPSPSSGPVTVTVRSQRTGAAALEIVDMAGRSIHRREMMLESGVTTYPLDPSDLPAGSYTVVIRSAFGQVSTRLIVQ